MRQFKVRKNAWLLTLNTHTLTQYAQNSPVNIHHRANVGFSAARLGEKLAKLPTFNQKCQLSADDLFLSSGLFYLLR